MHSPLCPWLAFFLPPLCVGAGRRRVEHHGHHGPQLAGPSGRISYLDFKGDEMGGFSSMSPGRLVQHEQTSTLGTLSTSHPYCTERHRFCVCNDVIHRVLHMWTLNSGPAEALASGGWFRRARRRKQQGIFGTRTGCGWVSLPRPMPTSRRELNSALIEVGRATTSTET